MVQAQSAVPFPSSPSTVSSSPPSQWDPAANQAKLADFFASSTPTQTSPSPQQKTEQQTPERPSQPHTPLTPPLTPASSSSISGCGPTAGENGNMNNLNMSAFSTPARGPAAPPPTPSSTGLLSGSNPTSSRLDPPSPTAVGTGSGLNSGVGAENGWPAPSPTESRHARPFLQRLEVGTIGNSGTIATISLQHERKQRSIDLSGALPDTGHIPDFRSADGSARDNDPGGERFLLVGDIPNNATDDELKNAFYSLQGFMGVCVRFLETQGIVILAFCDCRLTTHAERQITTQGKTFFNGRNLRAEKLGAKAVRELMGESEFVDKTEGEVVVTADGKIDANSLRSIVAGFGELRAFSQANHQMFITEFYDCRCIKDAMEALNGRSFFGIRLHVVPKHAMPKDLLNRVSFPQNSENAVQQAYAGSQPTSPLATTDSFGRVHTDTYTAASSRQEQPREKNEAEISTDGSNSSPFHGSRALPLVTSFSHSHSLVSHGSAGRRISTGSVGPLHGGTSLHQSTSEQDLRRRAAANNAAYNSPHDGWMNDHARRTSDTFCFDALRRAAGDLGSVVTQAGHSGIGSLGRPRTRAISESSASPRITSPSDGFSTAGMDVGLPGEVPVTPERNITPQASTYRREDRDREGDAERSGHTHSRFPTSSDSSLGGPHTPPPGPLAYNVSSYYMGSPSILGVPGLHSMQHGAAQYYLGSPLSATVSPTGLRYGYAPHGTGYSPGALSVHSSSSSSSMHSPSDSSMLYSPHLRQAHLPSSARLALDVTRDPPNERNQVDLERIAAGLDTRTTVMIKNIPNKLTQRDLIEFINRVCPRKFDFLYLRMDFQNGCNVGYAFVNFIYVEDLLHFARTKLGIKWNMYSSEKVLQMSYANYQGKEALVEKFKNSCVMDERESWRPKIFYSSGPSQGLPEPFPAPTHYRRKERSAQNRGALFLPSAHPHGNNIATEKGGNAGSATGMISAPFRRPNQHPQNLARQDRY